VRMRTTTVLTLALSAALAAPAWGQDSEPAVNDPTVPFPGAQQETDPLPSEVKVPELARHTIPTSGPVTVVLTGDIAAGDVDPENESQYDEATARLAVEQNPHAIVGAGDLTQGAGCYESYVAAGGFEGSYGPLKDIFLPVPGNHDWARPGPNHPTTLRYGEDENGLTCAERPYGHGYFKYFEDPANPAAAPDGGAGVDLAGYWATRVGDWTIIALNSNCNYFQSKSTRVTPSPPCGRYDPQINFMRRVLQRKETKCQAVVFHHPIVSSKAPYYNSPELPGTKKFMEWVGKVSQANGADLWWSAHNHAYERVRPVDAYTGKVSYSKGVRQFVSGTGGFSQYLYSKYRSIHPASGYRVEGVYGVTRFKLTANGWSSAFIGINGTVYDQVGASCR
jgi:hypothetical protein